MNILTRSYKLSQSTIITKDIMSGYVNLFWDDVYIPLNISNMNSHLLLMCKVEFSDPALGYRTLGDMRKVNFSDKNLYIEFLLGRLGLLSDSYSVNLIDTIVFTYIIRDGIADDTRKLLELPKYEVKAHAYNNYVLPLTMNPSKYGSVIAKDISIENITKYVVSNDKHSFVIDSHNDGSVNNVKIMGAADLSWV